MAFGLRRRRDCADVALAGQSTIIFRLVGVLGRWAFGSGVCLYVVAFFILFVDESAYSPSTTARAVSEKRGGFGAG